MGLGGDRKVAGVRGVPACCDSSSLLFGGRSFRQRVAVLFRGFAGFIEGAGGVLVGLAGKLVGGEAALAVGGCGGGVGVGGKVVEFGGSVVWALGHGGSPAGLDADGGGCASERLESVAELAEVVVGVEVGPAHPLGGGHGAEDGVG